MAEINSIGICNRLLGSAKQRIADLEFDLENVKLMLSVHLAAGVELRAQLERATEALRTWLIEVSGDDEEERQVARQLLGLPNGWPHGYECDCCPRNSQASGAIPKDIDDFPGPEDFGVIGSPTDGGGEHG